MWWPEHRAACRVALALATAGLAAACFQPMYGQRSVTGGPALGEAMRAVEVAQVNAANGTPEARLGVEIRNNLIFDITGGAGQVNATHKLQIQLTSTKQLVIVDITTARPDVEQYGINAYYSLIELATNRAVVVGQTFARVSFDIPGQEQRFARARGQRDAENRAAKVISDNIKSRLASYFVAGT